MLIDELEVIAAEGDTGGADRQLRPVKPSAIVGGHYYRGAQGQVYSVVQPFSNDRNLALGATVTVSNTYGNVPHHHKDFLVDGAYGTGSSFRSGSSQVDVILELDQEQTIDEVMFGRDRYGHYANNYEVGAFTIAVSTDGTNYTSVFDSQVDGVGAVDFEYWFRKETVRASFPAVDASFVKFEFTAATGWPALAIDEIEIQGPENNASTVSGPTSLRLGEPSEFNTEQYFWRSGNSHVAYHVQPYQNDRNVALGADVVATDLYVTNAIHQKHYIVDGAYGNGSAF